MKRGVLGAVSDGQIPPTGRTRQSHAGALMSQAWQSIDRSFANFDPAISDVVAQLRQARMVAWIRLSRRVVQQQTGS